MFEKNMRITFLLDFYGDALDERTQSILKAYYEDDLSLAEIAEGENISRQGVRHFIKKGEEKLLFLEERLMLASHYEELVLLADKLESVKEHLLACEDVTYKEDAKVISEVISTIINKGV